VGKGKEAGGRRVKNRGPCQAIKLHDNAHTVSNSKTQGGWRLRQSRSERRIRLTSLRLTRIRSYASNQSSARSAPPTQGALHHDNRSFARTRRWRGRGFRKPHSGITYPRIFETDKDRQQPRTCQVLDYELAPPRKCAAERAIRNVCLPTLTNLRLVPPP
jgi:hypothetical protein